MSCLPALPPLPPRVCSFKIVRGCFGNTSAPSPFSRARDSALIQGKRGVRDSAAGEMVACARRPQPAGPRRPSPGRAPAPGCSYLLGTDARRRALVCANLSGSPSELVLPPRALPLPLQLAGRQAVSRAFQAVCGVPLAGAPRAGISFVSGSLLSPQPGRPAPSGSAAAQSRCLRGLCKPGASRRHPGTRKLFFLGGPLEGRAR